MAILEGEITAHPSHSTIQSPFPMPDLPLPAQLTGGMASCLRRTHTLHQESDNIKSTMIRYGYIQHLGVSLKTKPWWPSPACPGPSGTSQHLERSGTLTLLSQQQRKGQKLGSYLLHSECFSIPVSIPQQGPQSPRSRWVIVEETEEGHSEEK